MSKFYFMLKRTAAEKGSTFLLDFIGVIFTNMMSKPVFDL